MEQKHYLVLKKVGWALLIIILLLNLFNWYQLYVNRVRTNVLPFQIEDETVNFTAANDLKEFFSDKIITHIDSLDTSLFRFEKMGRSLSLANRSTLDKYVEDKNEVTVYWQSNSTDETGSIQIATIPGIVKTELLALIFNLFLVAMIFFNCYLLLRFSTVSENILIVFFFLFLAFPEEIQPLFKSFDLNNLVIPLIGTLFYHFIRTKISKKPKMLILYIVSVLLSVVAVIFKHQFSFMVSFLFGWTLLMMLLGFLNLNRAYRKTGSLELRRLFNAFRGLFITLISGLLGLIVGIILTSSEAGFSAELNNPTSYILVLILLILGFVFILGILWFFGSFTWSLLTGTAMDVKIRSTLIYSIVGVLFVTIFGLIDYSLGELLQSLFGNFIGSEFIAGIPATIGLLIFFNPIRNKVESIVDIRLNSSELDFLSNADTFSKDLGAEGVIEGFEEYICENLMRKLQIKKVALVSYDYEQKRFKFNEVRGSDVVENSPVDDVKEILDHNEIYRSYRMNEDKQDISSFNCVIPIIFEDDEKWFLALGKKNDGSAYSKRDEEVLRKLAERIKLSLKFILVYDGLQTDKQSNQILDLKEKLEIEIKKNQILNEKLKAYEYSDQ